MLMRGLLENRLLGLLFGMLGLFLLWPIIMGITLAILFTCGRSGPLVEEVQARDDPSRSALVFHCDGPLKDCLERHQLLDLPALISLVMGRVTMLELLELDWGR
jgi:hypothetical protein